MPKQTAVQRSDIAADLLQIERALLNIDSPNVRYWIATFVDLIAEGVVSVDTRAAVIAKRFTAKDGNGLHDGEAPRAPITVFAEKA